MFRIGSHQTTGRTAPAYAALAASILWLASGSAASAQSLNWEGQTGVFVTPLAYTAGSPKNNLGKPIVAYHYLNAGEALGGFHTASVTLGLFSRAEFGYTRVFHQAGGTAGLSALWKGQFNIVHGKVGIVPENGGKNNWLPGISAGFVARTHNQHVSGILAGNDKSYNNYDFFVVATKLITQSQPVPILLNFGVKATNASVFGLAGNAPAYEGRLFGAAAFVFKGPKRSQLIFGSEFAQQPKGVLNLPGADVPTTITYAARIVPAPERARFNIDFGVAQAAGKILPGVDLKVRHNFAFGVSYGF